MQKVTKSRGVSFRTRLFVVSAALVTCVLAIVATVGWNILTRSEMRQLDERLCMEVRRITEQQGRANNLDRLRADIAMKLGLSAPSQLMYKSISTAGAPPIQSENWPVAAWQATMSWSARQLVEQTPADAPHAALASCRFSNGSDTAANWRYVQTELPTGRAYLAVNLEAINTDLRKSIQSAAALLAPLALGLIGLSAWIMANYTMRPVKRLTDAMASLTPNELHLRVPIQNDDLEFKALIEAYNTMLERLETSFFQASRFAADAAHELKTPLTIMQGRLEMAIQRANGRAVQAELGELLEEVFRLNGITRKLLVLAQADAGKLSITREAIDFSELVDNSLSNIEMSGGLVNVNATVEAGLQVQGDHVLLEQLLNNLISNAMRHGLPSGWIKIHAYRTPTPSNAIVLEISNACKPLSASQRQQFFRRFFRGDPAHSRRMGGSGLGLSLCKEIARAHGGDLDLLQSNEDVVHLSLQLPSPFSMRGLT